MEGSLEIFTPTTTLTDLVKCGGKCEGIGPEGQKPVPDWLRGQFDFLSKINQSHTPECVRINHTVTPELEACRE